MTATPGLDALFRCDYFQREYAYKHCLRRQLERQEAVVVVRESAGGTPVPPHKVTQAGPPVHAHCASGRCEQGAGVRALFPSLPLSTCGDCGTALVGVTDCPTCAARAAEGKPPRVLPVKPVPSERIWKENLPEAPFVPPATKLPQEGPRAHGQRVAGADGSRPSEEQHPEAAGMEDRPAPLCPAGRRDSEEGGPPAPSAAAISRSPARPAEEDDMPKGVRPGGPCKGCGSKGNRHIGDCPEAGKAKVAAPKAAAPRKVQPQRIPRRSRNGFDPQALSDEQLADCVREACDRRERIEREAAARVAKLAEALKGVTAA